MSFFLNISLNISNLNNISEEKINYCNVSINISTNQTLYNNRDQIKIQNVLSNDSFNYEIEYWVEDLFGREVKRKIITSNQNKKSYTPKIEDEDRVLFVKNKLTLINCTNLNNQTSSEKIILIKNKILEEQACESKESSSSTVCNPEIIIKEVKINEYKPIINSFYTRAKKFNEEIKLYANIKGEGEHTLILYSFQSFFEQNISLNGTKSFSFNISAIQGLNIYYLEVYYEGELLTFEKLEVNFESEKKIINQTIPKQIFIGEEKLAQQNYTSKITGNTIYESDEVKNKSHAIYFLFIPFIILLVILIIKKRF